jgi:transcriptional regulator with XRE-family HTH domain
MTAKETGEGLRTSIGNVCGWRPTGQAVAAARTLLGMSQRELASVAGVSYGALQRFEGGKVGSRLATFDRIVRALSERGIRFLEETETVEAGVYLSRIPERGRLECRSGGGIGA